MKKIKFFSEFVAENIIPSYENLDIKKLLQAGNPKTVEEVEAICQWLKLKNYTINPDLTVDVNGDVDISNKSLKRIPVIFNQVKGNFIVSENQLESLENGPKIVGKNFYCDKNKLVSLDFCPQTINRNYSLNCSYNLLKTLDTLPKDIENLDVSYNYLETLGTSLPKNMNYLNCSFNRLKSLKGSPEKITSRFYCNNNLLESLEGGPKEVYGDYLAHRNQLVSLKGIAKIIKGDLNLSYNKLENIDEFCSDVQNVYLTNNNFSQSQKSEIESHIKSIAKVRKKIFI